MPADERPAFAMAAGLLALRWLVPDYGYAVTRPTSWRRTTSPRRRRSASEAPNVRGEVRPVVSAEVRGGFVTRVLGGEFGQ